MPLQCLPRVKCIVQYCFHFVFKILSLSAQFLRFNFPLLFAKRTFQRKDGQYCALYWIMLWRSKVALLRDIPTPSVQQFFETSVVLEFKESPKVWFYDVLGLLTSFGVLFRACFCTSIRLWPYDYCWSDDWTVIHGTDSNVTDIMITVLTFFNVSCLFWQIMIVFKIGLVPCAELLRLQYLYTMRNGPFYDRM